MANNGARAELQPELEAKSSEAIRVIVADSEPIFRVGVRKIVAVEDDIRIVAQVDSAESALTAVGRYATDLILFEGGLSDTPHETVSNLLAVAPSLKIVLIINDPT